VTLQNRVNPWGELEAAAARGTLMGNRGGKFHRPDRTLGARRWASRRWICCELQYKGWHHEPMGAGYTSVFFLDEVTALAAGHRPCFLCRRADAMRFMALAGLETDVLDRRLHAERTAVVRRVADVGDLPDGAMIDIGGQALAVRGTRLLVWSHGGYVDSRPRTADSAARLLTPPAITAILRAGYQPRWHESAMTRGGT
jgi:hypothetical protein